MPKVWHLAKKTVLVFLPLAVISGCSTVPPFGGVNSIHDTTERIGSRDDDNRPFDFFQKEKKYLATRRKLAGRAPDAPSTALALSGGGIRSNAFQLGFLSGLSGDEALQDIDYISAVSGGSWAAGAYKIHDSGAGMDPNDRPFFANLEREIYSYSPNKPAIAGTNILFSDYEVSEKLSDLGKLPTLDMIKKFDKKIGATARDKWQRMIKETSLQGKDLNFCEIEEGSRKPLLIVNATHNAVFFIPTTGNQQESFPFEFSAGFIGTIADCGNTNYCGFFRHLSNSRHVGAYVVPGDEKSCNPHMATLPLSKALAASGAVTPRKVLGVELNLLDWRVSLHDPYMPVVDQNGVEHVPSPDNPEGWKYPFRYSYDLTDGGQSDNLGVLPLLERGVKRIIVADEAYDPSYGFGDFQATASHAARLLGVTITLDEPPSREKKVRQQQTLDKTDVLEALSLRIKSPSHIVKFAYSIAPGEEGEIIYLKPNLNIDGFMRYLRAGEFCKEADAAILRSLPGLLPDSSGPVARVACAGYFRNLYDYLFDNSREIKFPFDPTMEGSYDKRVIHAFYWLGKYTAEREFLPSFPKTTWNKR